MFTGIIEEVGIIKNITTVDKTLNITITAKNILHDTKIGNSIAINGVCLTVTEIIDDSFNVDVMPETFNSTSLKDLVNGSSVNLERSLAIGDRLGGHFVTGHIDGTGIITEIVRNDNALEIKLKLVSNLAKMCIYKGSIAIDGISLTIFGIENNLIKICLIPHTAQNTTLGLKQVGSIVNIECDMIGKYIANLTHSQILKD